MLSLKPARVNAFIVPVRLPASRVALQISIQANDVVEPVRGQVQRVPGLQYHLVDHRLVWPVQTAHRLACEGVKLVSQ